MDSMTLRWSLVGDVLPQISALLLVLFDLVGGVAQVRCLVCLEGVLSHGPIWCVLAVVGIFLR
jgi:hypothetical protein